MALPVGRRGNEFGVEMVECDVTLLVMDLGGESRVRCVGQLSEIRPG